MHLAADEGPRRDSQSSNALVGLDQVSLLRRQSSAKLVVSDSGWALREVSTPRPQLEAIVDLTRPSLKECNLADARVTYRERKRFPEDRKQ